jgi:hypothetical protein
VTSESSKTLPELIAEVKDELKDFVATRLAMLRAEIRDKLASIKLAAPGLIAGLVLVATGWLLFTAFLVCAIANVFGNMMWKYPIAFLIVAALYSIGGFIAITFAWQQIKETRVKPEHTIRVLKEDQIWLQTEVKTQ